MPATKESPPRTRLRTFLERSQEPQYVVATMCGVNPSTLVQYSYGRRPIKPDHLIGLAQYFGVRPQDLVGLEDE